MTSDKIKVAVRVRPFNRREIELGTPCIVEMEGSQTILQQPPTIDKLERKPPKTFAFDHCFNSADPLSQDYADQDTVFDCLGTDILDNAFQGYNACIFAYGQTGSGKSYTMMGSQDCKGIIPRLCDSLFDRIAKCQSPEQSYKVEVSYMEIYNEKVHDLLDLKPNKQSLKVREHAVLGPYVDGLSLLAVSSFQDIDNLMTEGNKSRTVAATNMNSESSRSHAVFTVVLTQTLTDKTSGVTGERVSRMSLVDLAGSERAAKTGAVGDRLKEGSNINKSLTTLGLVISKLADQSSNNKVKDKFVPYRDSVLTWLLKDNLGGNSKTVMVATISPAADNYEETLSTLRYSDRAKRIVNHAVVNEDPNARIIRELRQEVEALKEMLKHATATTGTPVNSIDIHEKLTESEKLMREMSTTWEEKLIKTEQVQQERQEALENMGISVQASGIKVEKNKFYLVNLNADPSLNELLVYYLKNKTLVGARGDIQLSGQGIQPEHCVLTIEDDQRLFMTPMPNARSFVNGASVFEKTQLHNGDRILWGNHHFFRVNCPKSSISTCSEPQTPAQTIDYNFAREELMLNELSNDPLQAAIAKIERQHEEDKQVALEKQRREYEKQFQQLKNILSPSTPFSPYIPFDNYGRGKMTPSTPTTQMRVEKWAKERDDLFRRSLAKLKGDIVRANILVQEANFLSDELGKQTKFSVTLQIPPANLSPNRKGKYVSEPAILVKRQGVGSQVWSMEKLENKLVDMRDMYEERMENNQLTAPDENPAKAFDPFYETQENHNLIGVANVFLEVLCHDVTLDYQTPIISQQGEVAGRLQVEISRISGTLPQDRMCETGSESSSEGSRDENDNTTPTVTIRVSIKQASGLPPSLSNFVFCQYTFWTHQESIAVPPKMNPDQTLLAKRGSGVGNDSMTFLFDHTKEFTFAVTEEFIEHCAEGALSIEVWGHRSAGFTRTKPGWEVEQHQLAKARSLADRWSELTRKIELWVEIHELNEVGEYSGVEVVQQKDVLTGGVFQLRQGQQRRFVVRVAPVQQSGTLPIICEEITTIAVGSVCARSRLQKPLDSYQEEDLTLLREKWSEALLRRRKYLDQQIQRIINKQGKSDSEVEREQSLVEQWVSLTEERNAVMVPAPGSGIPGAPADWTPPSGMEPHVPVLFLDLNADDLSASQWSGEGLESVPVAGLNSILPKELGNKFYNLPIIKHCDKDVCAVAAWDSSVHDSIHLNRVTDGNERVYLILKTTVRLSHPAPMDLVLRKRLCLNIYKRQSLTDRIRRKIVRTDWLTSTGVTYEVVSNIPKASEELEERESLAQIAASGEDSPVSDGESYIETYTKGVSAVESILTLERLRQKVAVKEILQHKGITQIAMRKTASVPNFSQLMMFDGAFESLSLSGVTRSESVTDLNKETTRDAVVVTRQRKSLPETDSFASQSKQFGIARPTFLNLNLNLNTLRLQPSSKPSPNTKMGLRMTTLHEEQTHLMLHNEDENMIAEEDEPEEEIEEATSNKATLPPPAAQQNMQFTELETYQIEVERIKHHSKGMSSSRTVDSLAELQSGKGGTPSTSSSGYGSQAVSSSNLTSDDCLSIRSISVDDTPDVDRRGSIPPPVETAAVEPAKRMQPAAVTTEQSLPLTSSTESRSSSEELPVPSQSNLDNETVTSTGLPPGKVVRRKKSATRVSNSQNRASFPQVKPILVESKMAQRLEQKLVETVVNGSIDSQSSEHTEDETEAPVKETPIPEWVCIGESVQIRPYNSTGVIAYIGPTEFASGTWVGVDLDAPIGKNDGVVQGVHYFDARPKHGIFVRADKLIQDRRGRAMRGHETTMRRSSSRETGLSSLHRSRSRGEGISSLGKSSGRLK